MLLQTDQDRYNLGTHLSTLQEVSIASLRASCEQVSSVQRYTNLRNISERSSSQYCAATSTQACNQSPKNPSGTAFFIVSFAAAVNCSTLQKDGK